MFLNNSGTLFNIPHETVSVARINVYSQPMVNGFLKNTERMYVTYGFFLVWILYVARVQVLFFSTCHNGLNCMKKFLFLYIVLDDMLYIYIAQEFDIGIAIYTW